MNSENTLKRLIFIWLLITFSICLFANEPYVLMVSFDGFRFDYDTKTETPNLDLLRDNGVKAESIQPVFPSKTFPNHYALATGAYAATNMITANKFYDNQFREVYQIDDKSKVRDEKWYKAEPLWVTAERQNVKSASYFWVGSEAPIKGYLPSIVKAYDHDFPYIARVDSVMTWLKLPEEKRPHLVMLYFDEPDSDGHKYGPENPDLIPTIEYMDDILGYILVGINKLDIADEINLVLVSDHGMTTISQDRIIYLDDLVSNMDAFSTYGGGPVMQVHLKEKNNTLIDQMDKRLKNVEHLTAYKRDEVPERYHFVNRNTGDFVLVADEGWLILTKAEEYRSNGTHGYDPAVKNMHGIFYAMGPQIKSNYKIGTFENIHVYPLICELLGIKPYADAPDAPEGRLEVLEEILVK
ncbi:MAG: ectonucleotide pyrophosphatase/phosphodiesterase [Candidatus Cloacimonetes bacterium]|jgi:predicted AlkP superfamily pyrophosphatase or phosphodiesterase|nr:ectonucleotide pyrophosphatase/phosphodiesterase [Candidatus Cloacimonadota bacterium]